MRRWFSLLLLGSVLCLYISALIVPAAKVDELAYVGLQTIPGGVALLLGWLPPVCIPWSANLLLVGGCLALAGQRYKNAVLWSCTAALAGLTTPLLSRSGAFQELLVGYYLWQASLLLFAFGTVALHFGFRLQHTSALVHPKGRGKMRRLTLGLIVWLDLLSVLGSLAWARTWTDTTGRFKVEAELVEVKDGNAVLKKADGPVIAVALQKLSPADREYVNHWAALKKEHPWLDTDAPFDVVTFLAPFPEAENAANLYPDALFEFGGDVAYMFSAEEQQRRSPIARKRWAEDARLDQAWTRDPKSVNPAELAAWLAEYETGFQKLALAQQRPRCAFPCVLGVDSLLGHLNSSRAVGRVLSYRNRQDLQRGDIERPLQGVEMVLRLSRDLRPRGCGVSQLVSIALDTQCCDTLVREILLAPGLRREHCDRLVAALARHEAEALDPFQESQRVAFLQTRKLLYDYLHRSDLFDTQKIQKDYGIRGPVVFPLGNLALYASLTDAKWRLAREKYGNGLPGDTSAANIRPDQAEKSAELMRRVISGTLTSEEYARETAAVNRVFGTILGTAGKTSLQRWRACENPQIVEPLRPTTVAIFFEPEDFVNVANSCLRCEATRRGTQCLVALRRWQLEHREPPPDIEALVTAAGMNSVPIDPYCDRPLRLAAGAAAPVIYSIGPDGLDDGARTVWDGAPTHPGDFVFCLEPPRR